MTDTANNKTMATMAAAKTPFPGCKRVIEWMVSSCEWQSAVTLSDDQKQLKMSKSSIVLANAVFDNTFVWNDEEMMDSIRQERFATLQQLFYAQENKTDHNRKATSLYLSPRMKIENPEEAQHLAKALSRFLDAQAAQARDSLEMILQKEELQKLKKEADKVRRNLRKTKRKKKMKDQQSFRPEKLEDREEQLETAKDEALKKAASSSSSGTSITTVSSVDVAVCYESRGESEGQDTSGGVTGLSSEHLQEQEEQKDNLSKQYLGDDDYSHISPIVAANKSKEWPTRGVDVYDSTHHDGPRLLPGSPRPIRKSYLQVATVSHKATGSVSGMDNSSPVANMSAEEFQQQSLQTIQLKAFIAETKLSAAVERIEVLQDLLHAVLKDASTSSSAISRNLSTRIQNELNSQAYHQYN